MGVGTTGKFLGMFSLGCLTATRFYTHDMPPFLHGEREESLSSGFG